MQSGKSLVKLARDIIEAQLSGKPLPKVEGFDEKQGVFVTLETHPDHDLRGCIGFTDPVFPLKKALVQAAISAAVQDPRFPPVTLPEMDHLVVEVSVLTTPLLLQAKPEERHKKIRIGRDGLIVRWNGYCGLLLPQVPVDWKWEPKTFLSQTCIKAGIPSDYWLKPEVKIYTFQAHVFCEKTPRGPVVKHKLD